LVKNRPVMLDVARK